MIWFLSMLVIAFFTFRSLIVSGFPNEYDHASRGFLEWVACLVVATLISGIISLIPFCISALIGGAFDRTGKFDRDYPLIVLRQQDGAQGKFFLGIGFIESAEYYFWYRKDGDTVQGGKTQRVPGVRLYISDTVAPTMRTYKDCYRSDFVGKYIWLVGIDWSGTVDYLPDFYIPTGSLKEGFLL